MFRVLFNYCQELQGCSPRELAKEMSQLRSHIESSIRLLSPLQSWKSAFAIINKECLRTDQMSRGKKTRFPFPSETFVDL